MAISVEPQSTLYLCKTPLEEDYKNQLTFASKTAQTTYFNSTIQQTFTNYTFIRAESSVKVDMNVEKLRGCNYLFYRNNGFLDENNQLRTFYCFITKIEYVDETTTKIFFSTDAFQTWYFDIVYKPCFIEREHVEDDTIGIHTVPEGLETGEYEILDQRNIPMYESGIQNELNFVPCFCVTEYPDDITNLGANNRIKGDDFIVGGAFSSLKFFATVDSTRTGYAMANAIINLYNREGHGTTADAIKNIFMIPESLVNIPESVDDASYIQISDGVTIVKVPFLSVRNFYESDEIKVQEPYYCGKNTQGANYLPKNAKLLSYPFAYFYLSNNNGVEATYKWEDFPIETVGTPPLSSTNRTVTMQTSMVATCGVSAKLYFKKYKGWEVNPSGSGTDEYGRQIYNYGIPYAKLPVCAWTTDYYTNWLTQQGVNNNRNIATSALTGLAMGALGGVAGAIIGGATGFLGAVTQAENARHIAETTPDQAKGDVNTGDYNFCFKRCSISMYKMGLRYEMAKIIDDYFNVFGYKVNVVKTPQFNSRVNWNYLKTVGCNADGNIPQDDLQTIRNMFDNGCTFWHSATNMYNYSLSNNIVS